MHRRVPTAPFRRTELRGLALAGSVVAGTVAALVVTGVAAAPQADAAATATVKIRDLTPPLVSIDPGGTVTFVNDIDDKHVSVDVPILGGLGLKTTKVVNVVVHTDVTLKLPSGKHELDEGDKVEESFAKSCLTDCAITYTYDAAVSDHSIVGSVLSSATSSAIKSLPQSDTVTYDGKKTKVKVGVPTPFLVNTIVPDLPNLPSANLPSLPDLTVGPKATGDSSTPSAAASTSKKKDTVASTTDTTSLPGFRYGTGAGAANLAPNAAGVAAGSGSGGLLSSATGSSDEQAGSGGVAGNLDSAGTTQYGQLAGLSGASSDGSDDVAVASDSTDTGSTPIGTPAILAVIALAGASSVLIKVQRARRAGR